MALVVAVLVVEEVGALLCGDVLEPACGAVLEPAARLASVVRGGNTSCVELALMLGSDEVAVGAMSADVVPVDEANRDKDDTLVLMVGVMPEVLVPASMLALRRTDVRNRLDRVNVLPAMRSRTVGAVPTDVPLRSRTVGVISNEMSSAEMSGMPVTVTIVDSPGLSETYASTSSLFSNV